MLSPGWEPGVGCCFLSWCSYASLGRKLAKVAFPGSQLAAGTLAEEIFIVAAGKALEELMDAKAQSWLAAVESQESSMAQQKKSAAKDIGKERPRIGGIGVEKPMPAEVRPMMAQSSDQPFDDPDWIFEMKWDGYRALATITPEQVALRSRNGLRIDSTYPLIIQELKKLKLESAILDGEIAVLDAENRQGVTMFVVSTPRRLYDLAALKAACSLASSSCESEVFKILPPVPFSSSSTLSLSGVAFLSSTNRVELPELSVADNSFMK